MDDTLRHALLARLEDGKLPCVDAFTVARRLHVEPLAVGLAADDAGIRISRCQLGLFGYGPKTEGKHKIVYAADRVPEHVAALLRADSVEGCITCLSVWQVADSVAMPRLEAAACVEAMGLRVSLCQLGCFGLKPKG